jgi:hypothetical protein
MDAEDAVGRGGANRNGRGGANRYGIGLEGRRHARRGHAGTDRKDGWAAMSSIGEATHPVTADIVSGSTRCEHGAHRAFLLFRAYSGPPVKRAAAFSSSPIDVVVAEASSQATDTSSLRRGIKRRDLKDPP